MMNASGWRGVTKVPRISKGRQTAPADERASEGGPATDWGQGSRVPSEQY